MKPEQTLYILQETLIGSQWHVVGDLVDVGDEKRARKLQQDLIGFVVADAPEHARAEFNARKNNEPYSPLHENFFNRIRSAPLYTDYREEWIELAKKLDEICPSLLFKGPEGWKSGVWQTGEKYHITEEGIVHQLRHTKDNMIKFVPFGTPDQQVPKTTPKRKSRRKKSKVGE